jgi:dipeptidyl aminopeptidase/acylaminoacyl peptidase
VDVDDACALVEHLAEQGLVDPQRCVISGGSAGGFTTLLTLFTRDTFAAGASYFGVSDIRGLAEATHKFESRYFDFLVGPLPESVEVYLDRSPITHADRCTRPLLVLQGLEDAVVPPAQAEVIVAALQSRGIPHAYLPFEGEQHGFRRAENQIASLQAELSFYGQVLGFDPPDVPVLPLAHADRLAPPAEPR